MNAAPKTQRRSPVPRLVPAFVSVAALAAGLAHAQQAPQAPSKEQDSEQLGKITVTATKRAEPLQSVPVAVSVVDGEQLEQLNLNNVSTITQQIPTLNYRANASNKDTSLFIRGVGTISTSPGVEPTVSTVVDGVVYARPGSATLDLMDVERIEVLRGPQGTLFGKNASAGVINIISKRPSTGLERFVDMSYYDGNEWRIRAGASGELTQGVAASISGLFGRYDGNVQNVFLGEDVNGYDRKGVRARAEIAAGRDVTVTLIGDYAKADDTGSRGPYVIADSARTAAIAPVVPGLNNTQVYTDVKERVNDKNWGLSGQVDWNVGAGTATSITAYREWENVQYQDIDGLSGPVGVPGNAASLPNLSDRGQLKSTTFSEELRYASPRGRFVDYVAGFFYMKTETDEVYRRDNLRCATTLPVLPNGLTPCATTTADNGVATYGTEGKSMSFFGESTWNFSKTIRGILGLRYTKDELSYYHSRASTNAAAVAGIQPSRVYTVGSTDETGVSGRVGPQFDIGKDAMAYATYSQGYKGPAYNAFFNMTSTADLALEPEKSKGWEIGVKSTFADNRLRVNLALFDTKYEGYQANYPDLVAGTVVTRFINAGDVSTKGWELDVDAKLSKQFTISGGLANTKARVDQFRCPAGATCANLNGKPLPSAPDWKGIVRANYWAPLASGMRLEVGGDYSWQSEIQYDLSVSPLTIQPKYALFNMYLAIANPAKGWRIALHGKNLADEHYAAFLLPGTPNPQRSVPRDNERFFGINARYEF